MLESVTDITDTRTVLRSIRALTASDADLNARYKRAKNIVRIFRKPAFYEITQRCNLRCEGCYYFEDGAVDRGAEEDDLVRWDRFFASEAERGVSMAYLIGAEPALEQKRMELATRYFPYSIVATNGTIRIDRDLPVSIQISVWGGDNETEVKLRGAPVFNKAFRNYAGDPRAVIYYTLTPWNLDGVETVVKMSADHGLPITFNTYSPTQSFLSKLASGASNDKDFFRVSSKDDSPRFSAEDLVRTRETVDHLIETYPDTVIYTHAYNAWVTGMEPIHVIDPASGVAHGCGSRVMGQLKYFGTDLEARDRKCCTQSIDCSECRLMNGALSSRLQPVAADVASSDAFRDWLDMIDMAYKIFVYDPPVNNDPESASVKTNEFV